MSKISFNFCSIIKQSGAAMSSKFMPPKVPAMFFIVEIISSEFLFSTFGVDETEQTDFLLNNQMSEEDALKMFGIN